VNAQIYGSSLLPHMFKLHFSRITLTNLFGHMKNNEINDVFIHNNNQNNQITQNEKNNFEPNFSNSISYHYTQQQRQSQHNALIGIVYGCNPDIITAPLFQHSSSNFNGSFTELNQSTRNSKRFENNYSKSPKKTKNNQKNAHQNLLANIQSSIDPLTGKHIALAETPSCIVNFSTYPTHYILESVILDGLVAKIFQDVYPFLKNELFFEQQQKITKINKNFGKFDKNSNNNPPHHNNTSPKFLPIISEESPSISPTPPLPCLRPPAHILSLIRQIYQEYDHFESNLLLFHNPFHTTLLLDDYLDLLLLFEPDFDLSDILTLRDVAFPQSSSWSNGGDRCRDPQGDGKCSVM
jgi:hypothetical protein